MGTNQQGGDPGAQGDGVAAMLGAGFLAEDDVQRPAHPRAEGQSCAEWVYGALRGAGWQQHPQAGDGQNHPDEVQQAARGKQRQSQRPGEFQRHGDAQRDALQGHVEHQIHAAQRQAVGEQGMALAQIQFGPPGLHHQRQNDRAEHQAQGCGAFGADQREQVLGQRRAALDRDHGHQQQGNGGEKCTA